MIEKAEKIKSAVLTITLIVKNCEHFAIFCTSENTWKMLQTIRGERYRRVSQLVAPLNQQKATRNEVQSANKTFHILNNISTATQANQLQLITQALGRGKVENMIPRNS